MLQATRVWRRHLAAAALLALALVAAACGSTTPTPAGTGAPASAGPTAASTATASGVPGESPTATGSAAPSGPVMLPAGVQFLDPGVTLPGGFGWATATLGGTTYFFGQAKNAPIVASGTTGHWTTVKIDTQKSLAAPAGYPYLWSFGLAPERAAASATGIVVAGSGAFTRDGPTSTGPRVYESYLWFSSDGKTWDRIDPRTSVGKSGARVTLEDVAYKAGAFWAVGTLVPAGKDSKTQAIALRSTDGRAWTVAATLATTWSSSATGVYEMGGRVVLGGTEYACYAGSSPQQASGGQMRLWAGDASNMTWTPVDLSAAGAAAQAPSPAPASAATCPNANDYQALQAKFMSQGAVIGAAGGSLVIVGPGGANTATTTDLVHWTTAALPGGTPNLRAADYALNPFVDARAHLLTADAGGLVLRSFEPRRDAGGFRLSSGWSVQWWRSTDEGTTWVAGPAGKPIFGGGAFVKMAEFPDGTVGVFQVPTSAAGPSAATTVVRSAAQPAVDWTHCTPGPKADCSYATISGNFAGADWTGMTAIGTLFVGNFAGVKLAGASLSAATLDGSFTGADFTGAQMWDFRSVLGDFTKANFTKAVVGGGTVDAPMTGANFTNADAQICTLLGDLTGAELAGGNFSSCTLNASYKQALDGAKANLSYLMVPKPAAVRDLSGANYDGLSLAGLAITRVNLTGASFAQADLIGTAFSAVNLTGAVFTGAKLDMATFAADVTCPDGAAALPPAAGARGAAACRITP